jgi:Tol biopolymer transport system component
MRRLVRMLAVILVVVALALVMGCGSSGTGTSPGPSVGTAASPPHPNRIVYERKVQQGKNWYSRLFTINPDGTGVIEVAGNGSGDPAWSPDGTKIVYSCSNRLYTMSADGSGKTPITSKNVDVDPAWSPNGATIAFARNSGQYSIGLYAVPATGGTA